MSKANELNDRLEIILNTYAKFLFDLKTTPHAVPYNLARGVIENSFKYIALDVNDSENLDSLFENLIRKGVPLKNNGKNRQTLQTWRGYLFSSSDFTKKNEILNNKYKFLRGYTYFTFDDLLSFGNDSSHEGGVKNSNPEINAELEKFMRKFFIALDSANAYEESLQEKIQQLEVIANENIKEKSIETTNEKSIKDNYPLAKWFIGLALISPFGYWLYTMSNKNSPVVQTVTKKDPDIRTSSDSTAIIHETNTKKPSRKNSDPALSEKNTNNTSVEKTTQTNLPLGNSTVKKGDDAKKDNNEIKLDGFINQVPPETNMAILIVDKENRIVNSVASGIANLYRTKGYSVSSSLFTGKLINSKYLAELMNSNSQLLTALNLPSHLKYIVIGEYSKSFRNSDGEYVKTVCDINLDIHVISCASKSQIDGFNILASGGHDDNQHAEKSATQSLLSQYTQQHLNL